MDKFISTIRNFCMFAALWSGLCAHHALAQTAAITGGELLLDTDIPSLERQIKPNRMVILDYSGSMRNLSAGGDRKMYQLARDAANLLVRGANKIKPDAKTGLIIFGNRHPNSVENMAGKSNAQKKAIKARSCNDINVELAYGQFTAASKLNLDTIYNNLVEREEGYRPQGESPVMAAIKKAAELMDDGGSIILITDFDEQICSQKISLCERYSEISETLVKRHLFLTHVVALERQPRAGESVETQLNQLAEIRKFTQCTAAKAKTIRRDGSGNGGAIKVVKEIEEELTEAILPAIVQAAIVFDGKPVIVPDLANSTMPAYFQISTGQDDNRDEAIVNRLTLLDIAPGEARVRAVIGDQILGDGKKFIAVRSQTKKLDFHMGTVKVRFGLENIEGRRISGDKVVKWTVKLDNGLVEIDGTADQQFELLKLPHQIVARVDGELVQYDFQPADDDNNKIITMKISAGGSPSVTSNLVYDQGGAFAADDFGRNIVLKHNKTKQISEIPTWENGHIYVVPGTYSIIVRSPNGQLDLGHIEVDGDDRLSIDGTIAMPQLSVRTNAPGQKTTWTLTNKDNKQTSFTGSKLLQALPPGQYKIYAETSTMSGEKNVDLKLGAGLQDLELVMREF